MFGKVTLAGTMPVYAKSSATTIRRAARKQLKYPAIETAKKVFIPAGRRAESETATSARTTSKRTEFATSTYAIVQQTVKKLEEEVRTVHLPTK